MPSDAAGHVAVTKRRAWTDILSRALAAALGGYACAYAATAALAAALPLARADAAGFAALAGLLVYVAAVVWAFAASRTRRAWSGLLSVTAGCAALAWVLIAWR